MINLFYQIRFYFYLIFTNRFKKETFNPINKEGYTLIFNDEFEGSEIDKTKWSTEEPWIVKDNTAWIDSQVSVKDGECLLTTDNYSGPLPIVDVNGSHNDVTTCSGQIFTYPSLYRKYGYYEIRSKVLPGGIKYWPAFWFASRESWPPEIDQYEYMGAGYTRRMTMTLHWLDDKEHWDEIWSLINECHQKGYLPQILPTITENTRYMQNPNEPPPWSADKQTYIDKIISLRIHKMHVSGLNNMDFSKHYHTYGMKWDQGKDGKKDRVTWYFDNLAVKTLKDDQWVNFGKYAQTPDQPMYTIIGNGATPGYVFKPDEVPASVHLSYFRCYINND